MLTRMQNEDLVLDAPSTRRFECPRSFAYATDMVTVFCAKILDVDGELSRRKLEKHSTGINALVLGQEGVVVILCSMGVLPAFYGGGCLG